MQYFAHRKHLIHIEKAEMDGFLHTIDGIQVVTACDNLGCDEFGNRFVINDKYFLDNYVPVRKLVKTKTIRKSPFEEQYEDAYKQSWVSPEDKQYIKGTYEISKNK
jgi:hypothetical protein